MATAGRVRAAGLDVAYDAAGSGPPLVLVHSAASDAREWRLQIAGLSGEFTVIAWDEPGAGRSSDVPADFGLAGYASCLAALIEALRSDRRTSPGSPGAAPSYRSSTATIPSMSRHWS